MNRWSPALLAGLMLAAAAQDAGAADGLPFTMKVDRLPNGLQVVTAHTDTPGIISYFTIVRTGSRDEVEKGRSGYAHFFEHMMFRGTKQWSSQAYSAKLQAHGADGNAYTTWDYTAYHVTAPKAALADVITLESDRFRFLDYDEAAYRTEAGAVLGEYNLSFSDPGMKAWEVLGETAFTTHTYGHTTIGYGADVKAMPEGFEYARAFFKRHYTPDNTTIIVAGDVEPAEVLAAITKAYGDWTGTHDAPVVPAEPEQT
ncbi:MAG: insulinase family protein, partial [Myxococcales bacterium]|nr:insulinase family protein [Myxococcales bacterium]